MRWSDVIYLISQHNETNDFGDTIPVELERKVYANKKSVRQSEFYQAMSNDLKPEIMFEITSFEYNDEPHVKYKGKRYLVIRTYHTKGDRMELVCEGLNNRG